MTKAFVVSESSHDPAVLTPHEPSSILDLNTIVASKSSHDPTVLTQHEPSSILDLNTIVASESSHDPAIFTRVEPSSIFDLNTIVASESSHDLALTYADSVLETISDIDIISYITEPTSHVKNTSILVSTQHFYKI